MHYINNRLIQPYIEAFFGNFRLPEQLCPEHMRVYDVCQSRAEDISFPIKIIPSPYPVLVISYSLKDGKPQNAKFTYVGSLSKETVLLPEASNYRFIAVLDDNMTCRLNAPLKTEAPADAPLGKTAYCDVYPSMQRGLIAQINPIGKSEAEFIEKLSSCSSPEKRAEYFSEYIHNSKRIVRSPQNIKNLKSMILYSKSNISVSEMSAYAGFSERSVNRSFTKYYGFGPKDYCKYIRFQYALNEIFTNPDRQNSEFIQNIGYADQAHFQREFKSFMGITPKQFTSLIKK